MRRAAPFASKCTVIVGTYPTSFKLHSSGVYWDLALRITATATAVPEECSVIRAVCIFCEIRMNIHLKAARFVTPDLVQYPDLLLATSQSAELSRQSRERSPQSHDSNANHSGRHLISSVMLKHKVCRDDQTCL